MSNGLNLDEDDEDEEKVEGEAEADQPENTKRPKSQRKNGASGSAPKHDLSAVDFLFKLDSEIRRSKLAANKKLREGESA